MQLKRRGNDEHTERCIEWCVFRLMRTRKRGNAREENFKWQTLNKGVDRAQLPRVLMHTAASERVVWLRQKRLTRWVDYVSFDVFDETHGVQKSHIFHICDYALQ